MTTTDDAIRPPECTTAEAARVAADDGRLLVATWFRPAGVARGGVVVAAAMATPAAYYRAFAETLTQAGFLVLTFDYRGVEPGGAARHTEADVVCWGRDAAAALESLRAELDQIGSELPITWVGHSLGGQMLAFIDHQLVEQIVVVATGNAYWRHNPPALRRWVRVFWNVVLPFSVRLAGYYPGRRLRFLDDLPAGVALQWRRWCLHPGYWEADVPDIAARHAEVTAAVTAIHLSDDEILTRAGIDALLGQLVSAPTELVELSPADLGTGRVGHHGFFRDKHAEAWRSLVVPRLASRPATTGPDDA